MKPRYEGQIVCTVEVPAHMPVLPEAGNTEIFDFVVLSSYPGSSAVSKRNSHWIPDVTRAEKLNRDVPSALVNNRT